VAVGHCLPVVAEGLIPLIYREFSASLCRTAKTTGFGKAEHKSWYPALRVSWERMPER